MVPLFGFMVGDTIGLLVLAEEQDTMHILVNKLRQSALVRVDPSPPAKAALRIRYRGQLLPAKLTVSQAGMEALGRFDVVYDGSA
jgi:hypothetical protein